MISRRNIRIKVMQLIYILETAGEAPKKDPVSLLAEDFEDTIALYTYLIHFGLSVARFAETDARMRGAKNLPSEADLNVNIKISGNRTLWQVLESPDFVKALETYQTVARTDMELVRKIYKQLTESKQYQQYILAESRDKRQELDILLFVYNDLLLASEEFDTHIEELFPNWQDDGEMLALLLTGYLNKPYPLTVDHLLGKDKWSFASSLLKTAIDKKEYTSTLIKPKLNNWDEDRIAQLDMVLMRLGVCELLFFETIPTKVTINEYIDIAKEYSTPQSGQFINGVIDNIHKELTATGKIQKIDYQKKKPAK